MSRPLRPYRSWTKDITERTIRERRFMLDDRRLLIALAFELREPYAPDPSPRRRRENAKLRKKYRLAARRRTAKFNDMLEDN